MKMGVCYFTRFSKQKVPLDFEFYVLSSIQVYYSERRHMMHDDAFWHFLPEIQIYKKFFKKTNNSDAERG